MTSKDLMIGDLVTDESGFPKQVTAIFDDTVYLDFEGNEGDILEVDEEDLKPIPITPEILEKNGIMQLDLQPGFDEWESEDRKIMINYRHEPPSKDWTVFITDYDLVCSANIQYVHELQHALRLAGIDKQIEL